MTSFEKIEKNKFYVFGGKLADLMILSCLWLLCCLPVVTIGPSTAALYYSVHKRFCTGSDSSNSALFFHSFRDNLRQGILLTVIYIVFCGFIVFDIMASVKGIAGFTLPEWYRMFAYVLILPVAFTLFYIFPYISRFCNSTKNCLFNSFLLSASHINHTFYLILMNAATLAACIFFPPALLVLPGLCTLLSGKLIEKDFEAAARQAEEAAKAAEENCEEEEEEDNEESISGEPPEQIND